MVDLDEGFALNSTADIAVKWNFSSALDQYESGEQSHHAYYELCNELRNLATMASRAQLLNSSSAESTLLSQQLAVGLRACEAVASRLDKRHEHHLVAELINLDWLGADSSRTNEVGCAYADIMASLLAVHNYYIEDTLKRLLKLLYPTDPSPLPLVQQLAHDQWRSEAVVKVLAKISHRVPALMATLLVSTAQGLMLHARKPYVFSRFFCSLLHGVARLPEAQIQQVRAPLLRLLLVSMRAVDAKVRLSDSCAPVASLLEAEVDDTESALSRCLRLQHEMSSDWESEARLKLDTLMWLLLRFLREECFSCVAAEVHLDMTAAVATHRCILAAFDDVMLQAEVPNQIHFVMLHICCIHENFLHGFLNYLWKQVLQVYLGDATRLAALAYLVDLVARSRMATSAVLRQTLTGLRQYAGLAVQRGRTLDAAVPLEYSRQRLLHGLCHALMYLVWFRHAELLARPAGRRFLAALRLDELLSSSFNPLMYAVDACVGSPVDWLGGFVAVMSRGLGNISCQAVLEMNRVKRLLATARHKTDEVCDLEHVTPLATPFARFVLPLSDTILNCASNLRTEPPAPPLLVLPPDMAAASCKEDPPSSCSVKVGRLKCEDAASNQEDDDDGWHYVSSGRKRRREPSEVLLFGVDVTLDTL